MPERGENDSSSSEIISDDERITSNEQENAYSTASSRISAGLSKNVNEYAHDYLRALLSEGVNFILVRIPPDGGWSWFVLFCSFLTIATLDGILLCIGHILPEIGKDLKLKETQTTIISSVQNGVYYLIGPIVSAAVNRFGFSKVGFTGSVVATCGMIGGSLAINYPMLLIFSGICVGTGFGMIYASSQIVVGYYFEKYRAIATGISCSGTGFGTLVFSRLNQYLVVEIGWRNTLRVHGGFCALVALLALVFRPVPAKRIMGTHESGLAEDSDDSVLLSSARYSRFFSVDNIRPAVRKPGDIPPPINEPITPKKGLCEKIFPCCYKEKVSIPETADMKMISSGPIYRDDIFYTGNLLDLPEYQKYSTSEVVIPVTDEAKSINYNLSVIRVPRETPVSKQKRCQIPRAIKDAFNLLLDVSIVKLFRFQVILLASFLFVAGNNIPYLFMTRRADIPEQYADWLLPMTGILNIVFRILSGLISFKLKKVDPAYLVGAGLIFSGIIGILGSEFGQTIIGFQFFYVFCFSIGASLFSTLRTVICVNILGLSKLTNAFGISSLAMGIGTFSGTTFGGVLVDVTGNFDAAFQLSGWSFLMSGVCNCYIPYITAKSPQKKVKFQK